MYISSVTGVSLGTDGRWLSSQAAISPEIHGHVRDIALLKEDRMYYAKHVASQQWVILRSDEEQAFMIFIKIMGFLVWQERSGAPPHGLLNSPGLFHCFTVIYYISDWISCSKKELDCKQSTRLLHGLVCTSLLCAQPRKRRKWAVK
jgi:hypothetical protein